MLWTTPRRTPHRASQAQAAEGGFTILEVVIALAILTLFGFGFLTLQLSHERLVDAADTAANLTSLARSAYEETREIPFEDLLGLDGASALVDARGEPVTDTRAAYRVTYATAVVEPGVIAVTVGVQAADSALPSERLRVVTWRDAP